MFCTRCLCIFFYTPVCSIYFAYPWVTYLNENLGLLTGMGVPGAQWGDPKGEAQLSKDEWFD